MRRLASPLGPPSNTYASQQNCMDIIMVSLIENPQPKVTIIKACTITGVYARALQCVHGGLIINVT